MTTPIKGSFLSHMHKQGKGMYLSLGLNCLHYLITSSKQNTERESGMEGESLGDYITCGSCDVISGRHTEVALSPGHSQILSRSRGENLGVAKSGSGLGTRLTQGCLMNNFEALPLSNVARQYHYCLLFNTNVAVPGGNQTLFRCVFQPHYHIRSAVAWNFY